MFRVLVFVMGVIPSVFALPAFAITIESFGPNGEGGAVNGQDFTVGVGGVVFELDAFVNIAGEDLNGPASGTSAQLSIDALPAGLDFTFSSALSDGDTDLTLTYEFTNNTGGDITGLKFLPFLDAEIDESVNTFFNEFAEISGVLGTGQEFEVDEPGFLFGDIFDNLLDGNLDNTNALPSGSEDDVAMGLAFGFSVDLKPGDKAVIEVLISEDGGQLGTFSITQRDSDPNSTTTITFSGEATLISPPSPADTQVDRCELTAYDPSDPAQIQVTVQDLESGLESVNILIGDNVSIDIPSFAVGTNDELVITATKLDQSQGARVELEVFDVSGNSRTCDPIETEVVRNNGRAWQRFTGVPDAEHKIYVRNGNPGLRAMKIRVNGRRYTINNMRSGGEYFLDVSKPMMRRPGDRNNTIVLKGMGKRNTSANVLITD